MGASHLHSGSPRTIGCSENWYRDARAAHLTCYNTRLPQSTDQRDIDILNQFEQDTYTVTTTQLLCAPSTKTLISQ